MVTKVPFIYEHESLATLRDKLREFHTRALCVLDEKDHLKGIVTLGDLQRAYEKIAANDELESDHSTVADICAREVVTVSPDDVLWTAIRNMGARDIGRLPVIAPGTGKLIGIVRRDDIMNAYNVAISRKLQDQHTAEQMRLNVLTGAHVFEMRIENHAPVVGKPIQDIKWPIESVVAAIRREDKLIVPHGNTILAAGDILTMVAVPEAEDDLQVMFSRTVNGVG
jgi:CIC family chloride channel protein